MKSQMERLREQENRLRIKRRQKALEYKQQLDDQIRLKKSIVDSTNIISDSIKTSCSSKLSTYQNQNAYTKQNQSSLGIIPTNVSSTKQNGHNHVTMNHPMEQETSKKHAAVPYKLFLEKQIQENTERRKAEREREKLMANITFDMATIMIKSNKAKKVVEQMETLGKRNNRPTIRANENNFKTKKIFESDELNVTSNNTYVEDTTSTRTIDSIQRNHMSHVPPNMARKEHGLVINNKNEKNYHSGPTFTRTNEETILNSPSSLFHKNEYECDNETHHYIPVSSSKIPLNSSSEIKQELLDHNLSIKRTCHQYNIDTDRQQEKIHDNCEERFLNTRCKWRTKALEQNGSYIIQTPNPYFNEQALTFFSQQLKMYIAKLRKYCNNTNEYRINLKRNSNSYCQMKWYEKSEETAIRKKNEIARQRKNAYDEQIKFKSPTIHEESMKNNAGQMSSTLTCKDILSDSFQKDKNYELNSKSDIDTLNFQRNFDSRDFQSKIDMNQCIISDDRVKTKPIARGKPSSWKKSESNYVHNMNCISSSSDFHTVNSFHNKQGNVSELMDDDDAIQSQSQFVYI